MNKVISPVKCMVWTQSGRSKQPVRGFCKIEWDGTKLSITGVIGPMSNGDCRGSCVQCTDEIRDGTPISAEGWTREMVDKFCDIWDRWHLNDMNPCCEHQRKLGWMDQAREPMTLYHYKLRPEAEAKKKMAEKAALTNLRDGKPFTPDTEQIFYANLEQFPDRYRPFEGELAEYYEPFTGLTHGAEEKMTRGWVRFDEDDQGILCKPCPVCGYKYGTAWLREDVPQDVIDWLFTLPDTPVRPAWV